MGPRTTAATALAVMTALVAAIAPAATAATPGSREQATVAATGPDLAFPTAKMPKRLRRGGPIDRKGLQRKLKHLARRAPGASGYYVFDMNTKGRPVLFDRSAGNARKLASNQKLFTTMTAMHRLGPRSRIATKVKAGGKLSRSGRLGGDIYLVGAGDPTFGAAGVDDLAKQVKQEGIRKIAGTVVGDDSVFDRKRGVPDTNYRAGVDIAPLSGLVYGGSTYDGDPAKEAAREFREALKDRGVRIGGKVKVGHVPSTLRDNQPVGTYESPTIKSIVRATNKDSVNFYAEMLLKRLWAEPGRKGTTSGGVKAVERFAKELGSKVHARDGSGLTDNNQSSPRNVVRLLIAAQRDDELAKPLFKSLAIAGKDGTLVDRMEGSPAAGRCRGKTGTINGVSNLSGYCKSDGGLIAFSLLMNGVTSYDYARSIQDRMVTQIARYR